MTTSLTSRKDGPKLEMRIYDLFRCEIEADRFWAKKEHCKIYWKKGYYSKDRGQKIVFDVAVEIFLPGATEYSVLVLIECKNYSHPVPVDDVEEFYSKVQQVAAANAKAVIVSTAPFQSGTRSFAKSKGIGLIRYFGSENFKWELKRSLSGSARSISIDDAYRVDSGLSDETFMHAEFDLYLQSPRCTTNSLWDFFEDLCLDAGLTLADAKKVGNSRSKQASQVLFYERSELEERSAQLLAGLRYSGGKVDLAGICAREAKRTRLVVETGVLPPTLHSNLKNPTLGRITFDPLIIQIYAHDTPNVGRDRFTLAHELAHHFLEHGRYMIRESCDERDFVLQPRSIIDGNDVARMEFQANYLAASLLMPLTYIVQDFLTITQRFEIKNRAIARLYVDDQPCNLQNFFTVTGRMMRRYGVSRAAITIRLESIGLLHDARRKPLSIQQILSQSWGQ